MKTKALISFAVTAKLICFFVFAYAKSRFSHDAAHLSSGLLTRSDKNQDVKPQKMAEDFKFFIKEVEGLFYLGSENKRTDLLHDYNTADLHLCFHICKKQVFS